MAALASSSFEFNMLVTEVTEDSSSDVSEEIDELAGDLEPITEVDNMKNDIPNNDKLVPCNDDNNTSNVKEQEKGGDDDIYEIEKIVDHRTYRGSIQYMIKWKGYSEKHNSWVSKEHESEYWNNKEIEAKEKIKSLADRHNVNTKRSKRQRSNRIKKNQETHVRQKKSFVELKSSKTNENLLNNNDNHNDKHDNMNGIISSVTPLRSSEVTEVEKDEANDNYDEGLYEKEEIFKEAEEDDDDYDNFTPAAIAGSWEPFVKDVATIQQDPYTGTLIVFLNWKNGHRTSHTNKVTNVKCPQKMLEFYQQHVQFVHQQH
ncbi:10162_t:CDS:2 [Funneliformis geosporum]|uniref:8853_t:CDS:1 n=1 Tax=Funneliformis geosporum TaxID=1117311 RepID=A0A9W4SNP9_9GLOM|nr:8853_t:CDS:2 [Funneliformis geosporum]CAI2181650.1 10162_t:CDS:2 [Funneliformis geosporum]